MDFGISITDVFLFFYVLPDATEVPLNALGRNEGSFRFDDKDRELRLML
jgi:hypothetical protein